MTRLPLSLRRFLSATLLFAALVATVATSPAPTGLSQSLDHQTTLSPAHPSDSFHFTVHLSAAANADVDGGRSLSGLVSAYTSECTLGVDTFDDAGVCVGFNSGAARPSLGLSLSDDLADGGVDGGATSLPVFQSCAVGQACDQAFTFTVSSPPGSTSTFVVTSNVQAHVESAVLGTKIPPGATLTITTP